ncbi:MAG TPA: HD domain-containing phosphohydrolase [Desulfatiglandales bacterium]|nr:HD domain-containing phosphohydrolase [Desulfatiglandales bacterium]
MPLKYKHSILLVDDEESITKALSRVFRKEGYGIFTASSGQQGLDVMKAAEKPFSLIISDQRMPGMSGGQFLEKVKVILPNAIRILLTGYSDMNAIIDAVNKGEIHRYLTKPWNDDDLLIQVRQSLEQYELIIENRRLLVLTGRQNKKLRELSNHLEEKVKERTAEIAKQNEMLNNLNKELETSFNNSIKTFGSLIEIHHPSLAGHGMRVSIFSREISQRIGLPEDEIVPIEIAALLHDIGKLGFPQKLVEYREDLWSPQEKELFRKHPMLGQETVQFINKLDHVSILIRCHHEQYDGNGYPDHLSEEEIPLGSRVISVADIYDKIVNLKADTDISIKKTIMEMKITQGHLTEEEVLNQAASLYLKHNSFTRYDPEIVKAFLDLLKITEGLYKEEKQISIEEMKPGMVLSRPLYSSRGRFLLPHNTILTENYIIKLKTLHENDPINSMIAIVK